MNFEQDCRQSGMEELGLDLSKELAASRSGDPVAKDKLYKRLLELAEVASANAYSPYSKFPVGAALLAEDGRVFLGCNVENASYGGAICAERTAIVKAVSEGCRSFLAIAVYCARARDGWPCGICRQFICEFGNTIDIVSFSTDGSIDILPIDKLLPRFFGPAALGLEI